MYTAIKRLKTYCIFLGFLFTSTLCYAENIVIGVPDAGYPPFIIIKDKHVSGILIEPLELAAKNIGVTISYTFLPENRSKVMLDHHSIDARMESVEWVSNPEDYLWSEPITQLDDILVYHKSAQTDYETEQALYGSELIAHLGYTYPTLEPLIKDKRLKRLDFTSERKMLQGLYLTKAGSKRVAIMNKYVAQWLIKETPQFHNTFKFSERVIATAPLQFQFDKRDELAPIVAKLNHELRKIKKNKVVEQIAQNILASAQ
ncbi:substrate-binding periplasmic protein [Thalassotalea ganghwensis]